MSDHMKIMVIGQVLAARIAAELKDDCEVIGFDLSRGYDETVICMSVPETYPDVPEYHSKPWVQTHPISPKPTKNRTKSKKPRKQKRSHK